MRNLFTALKQDTQANHTALENTFPFSIYHHEHLFNKVAYCAVLAIMKEFHQTTAGAVKQAGDAEARLAQIAAMIDSNAVLAAISKDIHALDANHTILNGIHDPSYRDTHQTKPDSSYGTFAADKETSSVKSGLGERTSKDTHAHSNLLPTFRSPITSAIAAIYVWLGSSMGANIISRRLNAMEQAIPTHYYKAMSECAKSWVSFKQCVDALLPELALNNENLVDNIVRDANAWFEYLIKLGMQFQATSASKNMVVDTL